MTKPQLLIACDFDGTITQTDTLVTILDAYGSLKWRQVQEKVVSGELSIREGLQQEMGSVSATLEELKALLAQVRVDPTFPPFFQAMRNFGIPLVCLSGGFDLCIETVLAAAGLWPMPYLANRLKRTNGSLHVEFPYPSSRCQDCGHCKADPLYSWKEQGYTTVFVGNGVTDRCAAKAAELTFAKEELSLWCKREGIPVVPFTTFHEIYRELAHRGWL